MIVLAKEIMIETLLGEIRTETGTIEDEGAVAVTAGAGVGAGVKRGCVTGTGIEAGLEAEAEHGAGVTTPVYILVGVLLLGKYLLFEGFKNCFNFVSVVFFFFFPLF